MYSCEGTGVEDGGHVLLRPQNVDRSYMDGCETR